MRIVSIVLGFVFFLGLYVFWPLLFIVLNRWLDLAIIDTMAMDVMGAMLIAGSLVFILYLFLLFNKYGHGTPVPVESTQTVIESGPYKRTRNPMYVTHVIIWLGIFCIFGDILLLASVGIGWFLLHLLVTVWEEPDLIKRLGQPYLDYLKRVPRWL